MPKGRTAQPVRITVRHAEPGDHPALARIARGRVAAAGTLQMPWNSVETYRKRLEGLGANERLLVACVHDPEGAELAESGLGEVVGNLGLHPAANLRRAHSAGIGMFVRDDWQGKGVGTALMAAAIDLADNWMGLIRLELTVWTDNAAAIHLYRKFGFEVEGTHRAYALRMGQYTDALAMARLNPAPPSLRAGAGAA